MVSSLLAKASEVVWLLGDSMVSFLNLGMGWGMDVDVDVGTESVVVVSLMGIDLRLGPLGLLLVFESLTLQLTPLSLVVTMVTGLLLAEQPDVETAAVTILLALDSDKAVVVVVVVTVAGMVGVVVEIELVEATRDQE